MQKRITPNDLEPGTVIYIAGKVQKTRIQSKIEGHELEEFQKRDAYPPSSPFNQIKLFDARPYIADPQNPTLAEQYGQQRCYASKGETATHYFEGRKMGPYNPNVMRLTTDKDANGQRLAHPVELEAELAYGSNVIVALKIFKSRSSRNNGASIDTVMVQEPIQYYRSGAPDPNLFAPLGIVIVPEESKETAISYDPSQAVPTDVPDMPAYEPQPENPEFDYQPSFNSDTYDEPQAMRYTPQNDKNRQY